MPQYFFDVAEGRKRTKVADGEFSDQELARQYAIGLAETMIRRKDGERDLTVIIRNARGDDIERIRPEQEQSQKR